MSAPGKHKCSYFDITHFLTIFKLTTHLMRITTCPIKNIDLQENHELQKNLKKYL